MKNVLDFLMYLAAGCVFFLLFNVLLTKWAKADIICHTAFKEKSIHITDESVAFVNDEFSPNSRSISSLDSVRTEKKHQGFIKIVNFNGQKHRVRIKNINAFSDVEDSLKITNPRGHEITYPLSCHRI